MRWKCSCDGDGYAMSQQRRGDTTDVMLDYVGYKLDDAARGVCEEGGRRGVAGGERVRG